MRTKCILFAASVLLACASPLAHATPYASGVVNNAGTVSFYLNENASNVQVIFNNGASTNNMGALSAGQHSFGMGGNTSFKIQVTGNSGPGYRAGVISQISSDTNNFVKFANGRGLAVNQNPGSPLFGRIYVSCGSAGTANGRATGDGIYILNPDRSDAVGQGDTARDAGINFNQASHTEGPFRLAVGPDDLLYITDNSDVAGALWITDPNVVNSTNVINGVGGPFPLTDSRIHGSIEAVHVEGSIGAGNLTLYVLDEDRQSDRNSASQTERNSLWRYDIGGSPLPYESDPTKIATVLIGTAAQYADLKRGPDGKFYCSQRRAAPGTTSGVLVRAADGSVNLWTSLQASRDFLGDPSANDILVETRSLAVSPDGKYLAAMSAANVISILPMTDGIPDMTNRVVLNTLPATTIGRSVVFDAANNLYTLSSGQGLMRVYSPGGFSIAITGSDSTFEMLTPDTTVTVIASQNEATEGGAAGEFTVTRVGGNLSNPLTVNYILSGTASNGADYATLSGSVIIPGGSSSVTIPVTPVDDAVAELPETVILLLQGNTSYGVGDPGTATVTIRDNETPLLSIARIHPVIYERTPSDYAHFELTRLGQTTAIDVNLSYGGSASPTDHNGPATVSVPDGTNSVRFSISAVNDNDIEGDETLIASIASGSGYIVGTPASAAAVIIVDDDLESASEIFSEDFEQPSSGNNWTVLFGALNGIDDKRAQFNYDYSADGIPPAPGSSTTFGLKMTVNKDENSANGAAGVNAFPNGPTLSGNYAVRFNMFLEGVNGASTTEHVLFGINHSGTKTNWTIQSSSLGITAPTGGDGLFFSVVADSSEFPGGSSYGLLSAPDDNTVPQVLAMRAASTLTNTFKTPPYRFPGSVANFIFTPSLTPNWVDVEIQQLNGVVTLKINNTEILQHTNSTAYTSGTLMLGYNDAFSSIAGGTGGDGARGFVVFDNVKVIQLQAEPPQAPTISTVAVTGGNVVMDFTGSPSDSPSSFTLESSSAVAGPYANAAGANIIQVSPGNFQVTVPVSGSERFYRIRR